MKRRCEIRRLGLVTYENGMQMQETLVSMRQREEIDDQFLLLQHPPVITLGRGGKIENLLATPEILGASGVRFFETTRGGDITYHGPGQLVGYPIIHLGEGNRDVRKYVWKVEETLIRTVAEYGIEATRVDGKRGIWVGNDKIGAIGVRIARWVTSHGFALNVDPNLKHFSLITPCGLAGTGVTSIRKLAGQPVDVAEVASFAEKHFADVFDRKMVRETADLRLAKVVVVADDRVLLLHRRSDAGDFWQPITGSIDEGESAIDAARRELFEETGVRADVTPLQLDQSFLISSKYTGNAPRFTDETAFVAHVDHAFTAKLDEEEHDAYGWFTFAEAYEKIKWTDDREALERVEKLSFA